jgi:ferredoxin
VFIINEKIMHKSIEKLAYKIAEAVQGDKLSDISDKINIYHRKVSAHSSADLAYSNGTVAGGLRSAALFSSDKNSGNYQSFQSSLRQHLPVVINLDRLDASIRGFENLNCFIFVASNAQQHVNLYLLAQKLTELSLVPGFVVAHYSDEDSRVDLPADEHIKKYLGNPDDQIDCPTPAQRIIFGNKRRRVPNWFNLDLPIMLGTNKAEQAKIFESMASEKYFADHLQDLITLAIAEYKAIFNSDIALVSTLGKKSNDAIITNSSIVFDTAKSTEQKHAPQLITLNQLKPFPGAELREVLHKTKAVTILESADLGGSSSFVFNNLAPLLPGGNLYAGRLAQSFSAETYMEIIEHMRENRSPKEYWVELQFSRSKSAYPKHEILLQEINKQYPELKNASLGRVKPSTTKEILGFGIPQSVREHLDKGPDYSKLSGFYDNIAFFYQQDEQDELVADPFTALPMAPAGSAGFFSAETERIKIPHFRPAKCTGCGDCFVQCPHAALPPIVIGIEQVMRVGMDLASNKGHKLLKLTPMLKNLAKFSGKSIGDKTEKIDDLLPEAFSNLCSQMKLEGEDLQIVQKEFDLVIDEISKLPVAITDTFFNLPEKDEKGSGELFSIALNPATCTGCGICAESCTEEAINMVDEDADLLTEARELFELYEFLPSVSAATIDRLKENAEYNQLAAMLLIKQNYSTMIGGSRSEDFNAYKSLTHLVTAAANDIVSPKRQAVVEKISSLIEDISGNVHESLSKALPKENLDALSLTLKETRGQKASFHEIVDRLEELGQQKMVDTRVLQRKTDLVDALKELLWVLETGPTGVGRANYGLYLTGSDRLGWAHDYPLNNFAAPALVQWQSSAPEQVLGLINSHIRHQVDNIKLIRRAEMEAAGKYDPAAHDLEIAALDWQKLTLEERSSIPPIIMIGDREDMNSSGWQSLNKLLSSEFPIKIIMLDHVAPPSKGAVHNLTQSYSALLNAITLKKAFVYQGTMNNPAHLAKGLVNGISDNKPALFNLYAFSEAEHDADSRAAMAYGQLAINSRTFPLLYFNPDKEHGFLNGSINLENNRELRENWITEDIPLPNKESLAYKITWADWAFTQEAWQSEFKKVSSDGSNVIMADYMRLSIKERANKVPVIIRSGSKGLVYYSASRRVVQMTESVLDNWNTLQELAGLITEFPVKLSEEVKKELTSKFDQDIAELKKEYDQKIIEKEQEFMQKMRVQIKERLIQLSNMARN